MIPGQMSIYDLLPPPSDPSDATSPDAPTSQIERGVAFSDPSIPTSSIPDRNPGEPS